MDVTPAVPAPALFGLSHRVALVTGASRRIFAYFFTNSASRHWCRLCYSVGSGWRVRCPAPGTSPNLQTLDAIRAFCGTAEVVYCDLDDLDAVKNLFQTALDIMDGQIHVRVNCAGVQRKSPSLDFPDEDWDKGLDVNLKSVWLLSQAAGRHMVPLCRGKIINLCSILTFRAGLAVPAYAAAKGALGQLTKTLSNEWSQHNVQVNGIRLGYIATDINEELLQDPVSYIRICERIPAGRWGEPQDIAGPVIFLASAASQYFCGELLVVDGVRVIVDDVATNGLTLFSLGLDGPLKSTMGYN